MTITVVLEARIPLALADGSVKTLSKYGLIAGKSIADRVSSTGGNLRQTIVSNSVFVIAAIIVMIHKKKGFQT